jgi:hypothetical protein
LLFGSAPALGSQLQREASSTIFATQNRLLIRREVGKCRIFRIIYVAGLSRKVARH